MKKKMGRLTTMKSRFYYAQKVVRTIRSVTNPIKKEDRGITRPVARSIKKVVRENERGVTIGLDRRKKAF